MSTITGTSTTLAPAQTLFVTYHGTPLLHREEKRQPSSIHTKSQLIFNAEDVPTTPSNIESNYDDLARGKPAENNASFIEKNAAILPSKFNYHSTPNNIVISTVTSVRTMTKTGSNDPSKNVDPSMNSVETVLVPIRDPLTRELKNVLVPIEVKDKTGMNVIKSVLVPVQDEDGLMSYQVKKVVVPINPNTNIPPNNSNPVLRPKRKPTPKIVKTVLPKIIHVASIKGKQIKVRKKIEKQKEVEQEREIQKEKETTENVTGKEANNFKERRVEESLVETEKEEIDLILEKLKNTCPFCEKNVGNEEQLQRHIRKNHKKPFRCTICSFSTYVSKQTLEEHIKSHGKDAQLICPFCNVKYKHTWGLRNHQIRAHSTIEAKYECDDCGKRFKIKRDLASHIEKSHTVSVYICRYCGKSVKNINQHEWQHENFKKDEFAFTCHVCKVKYKSQGGLQHHLLTHGGSKCDQCNEQVSANSREKTFNCKYCDDVYLQKECYLAHKLDQHGLQVCPPKEFRCSICRKSFVTEYNLQKHATLHTKVYSCSHCDQRFPNNDCLKMHVRKHTGERPYECKVCKKSFARSNSLRIHELIHMGKRPYVCDICGHCFTQRGSMMNHRRKHPGSHPPLPPLLLSKLINNENEMSTITETAVTRIPVQPLFVVCHGTSVLDQEERSRTPIESRSIVDDEDQSVISDVESNKNEQSVVEDGNDDDLSSDNNDTHLSEINHCTLLDVNNEGSSQGTVSNDSLPVTISNSPVPVDSPIDEVKTALVPVRDPITKEIKNQLVPFEIKDESGLNVIKSVVIPVKGEDGLLSYEVRKVTVPIQSKLQLLLSSSTTSCQPNLPQTKTEPLKIDETLPDETNVEDNYSVKYQEAEDSKGEKDAETEDNTVRNDAVQKEVKKDDTLEDKKVEANVNDESENEGPKADEPLERLLGNTDNMCPYCQKVIENRKRLGQHIRRNHTKPYRCDKCYHTYVSKEAYEVHVKTHEKPSYLECPFCRQRYKRMGALRFHQIRVHSTIEPQFECDYCKKRFKLKNDLTMHIDRLHTGDKHVCRFCGKNVRNIMNHEWQHKKSGRPYPFQCHLCPSKFRKSNGLENHLQRHKSGFKCNKCGEIFSRPSRLISHRQTKHKPAFFCTICKQEFNCREKFYLHVIRHAKLRPYNCDVCDADFFHRTTLVKHRNTHPGPLPPLKTSKIAHLAKKVLQHY